MGALFSALFRSRKRKKTTKPLRQRPAQLPLLASPFDQVCFSPHEKELIQQHLPLFKASHPSTEKHLNLILKHWNKLYELLTKRLHKNGLGATRIQDCFDIFYEHLFETAPELQPMFHGSMQFKGRALMNIIGGVRGVLQSEDVIDKAARIAYRHVQYGVKCEHFNPMGIALMKTLKALAPAEWKPKVEEAWRMVYCHVSVLVLVRVHQLLEGNRSDKRLWLSSASKYWSSRSLIRSGSFSQRFRGHSGPSDNCTGHDQASTASTSDSKGTTKSEEKPRNPHLTEVLPFEACGPDVEAHVERPGHQGKLERSESVHIRARSPDVSTASSKSSDIAHTVKNPNRILSGGESHM